MVKLTGVLMKRALDAEQVVYPLRATVAELVVLYDALPIDFRREFERGNMIQVDGGDTDDDQTDENLTENLDGDVENDGPQPGTSGMNQNRSVLRNDENEVRIEDWNDDDDSDDDNNNGVNGGAQGMQRLEEANRKRELLQREREILLLRQEIRQLKQAAAAGNRSAPTTLSDLNGQACPPPPIGMPSGVRMGPYPWPSSRTVVSLPQAGRPNFREIEVQKFSGEDVTYDVHTFLRRFETNMELAGADDLFRLFSLRRHLTDAAATVDGDFRTYGELKAALITEFAARATSASIEAQMRHRMWNRPQESLHRFVLNMEQFVRRLPNERLSMQEIVDLIVDNMRLPPAVDVLLRTAATTDELKNRVVRYAATINAAAAACNPPRVPAIATIRPGAANRNVQPNAPSNPIRRNTTNTAGNPDEVRCYNCSRNGHYKNSCPYELRPMGVCYKCWQPGHISSACQNRKRVQRLLNEVAAVQPDANEGQNEYDDPDNLAEGLAGINLVSAAFRNHLNQYTGFTNFVSLFDTGSPNSFVRRSALPFDISDETTTTGLRGVGGNALRTHGTIICNVRFNRRIHPMKLIILPDDSTLMPMILGRDFLKLFGIKLVQPKLMYNRSKLLMLNKEETNTAREECPRVLDLKFLNRLEQFDLLRLNKPAVEKAMPQRNIDGKLSLTQFETNFGPEFKMPQIYAVETLGNEFDLLINENLSTTEHEGIRKLINENYLNPTDIEVQPLNYEMDIHLTSEVPFHYRPRRLSYLEKLDVQKKICEMIEDGTISPSDSPYASAIVLVDKRDGGTRMCVDYRALNKLTVRDNYPLPLIDDCVEYMGGKGFFTLLDLKNGFHQVRVSERSRKFTSFVTPHGQYEYRRMPFGLKNAPAVFQRFVNQVFRDFLEGGEIIIYMDDILLASRTLEEHKELLRKILRRLAHRGLLLNLKKCKFCCTEIEYLGYAVTADGIRPSERHIAAIRKYATPTNAHEVRSCIGLFSYFRRFVPNFSRIARPLLDLMKEGVEFRFNQRCHDAFDKLKNYLTTSPVLAIYDPKRETELHCDASSQGFGAILLQKQDDGSFHPTAFFSKATSGPESRYHSFELETMAVLYALERFRVYLEGIPFTIVTDCNALTMAMAKTQVNARIARWTVEFDKYTFETRHRPGIKMAHVDALSRCHPKKQNDTNDAPPRPTLTKSHRCQVMTVDTISIEMQLQLAQNRDPVVANIRQKLETEALDDYELRDGLVYRKTTDEHRMLYVPAEMEDNIIRLVHEKLAHLGVDKCHEKMREQYWFPRQKTKTQAFINNCIKCIMYAAPVRPSEQSLYNIPKTPEPFDTLHLDHFGPLPMLMNKRKHVLVVVDAFTKYVKLFAVNTTSTREVIASLEKYFTFYSRPRRIITDRGTCFTSMEFAAYLTTNNITHVKVATASAQANGQAERVNRVLKNTLGKMSSPINHADWSHKLTQIEYAMNNSKHATTKETPSRLMFGAEQRGKLVDELTEFLASRDLPDEPTNLRVIRATAENEINKKQAYNEEYHRRKQKPTKTYEIDEYVVIRNVDTVIGTNKKLIPSYRGPYRIHKILGHDRYVIKDIDGCQLTQLPYDGIVEANKIRRWIPPHEVGSENCQSSESDTENEGNESDEEDFYGFTPLE